MTLIVFLFLNVIFLHDGNGNVLGNFLNPNRIDPGCKESLCPNGSFVMEMFVYPNALSWTYGNCHYPGNATVAKKIVFTTSKPPSNHHPIKYSCGLGPVRGLVASPDNGICNGYFQVPYPCCFYRPVNVSCIDNNVCGRNQAMSGLIENEKNKPSYVCTDVGHPAELCNPRDDLQLILVCDMLDAIADSECKYSQTVGYGNSTEQSQTERRELQFYAEVNFEIGASGFGLSANFGGKLGQSETTGFDWTKASSQTWSVETTIEVTMSVPAGIKTMLYQAIGRCSFYSVSTNFYKRVDTDRRGNIVSQSTFIAEEK